MKLKRLLAGVLTGIMVIGLAPANWKSCVNEVKAAENNMPSKEDEWLVNKYGLKYRFISQYDGSNDSVIAKNKEHTTKVGNVNDIFDGDVSTGVVLRKRLSGWNGDHQAGDYVGVLFKQAVGLKSVSFILDGNGDRYNSSRLEYTLDGNNWLPVDDVIFGSDVSTMSKTFESKLTGVRGIRLANAAGYVYNKWVCLQDISFDTDFRPEATAGTNELDAMENHKDWKDGDVSWALDGEKDTKWHSSYKTNSDLGTTNDEFQIHKFWFDMKLPELTELEGVKILQQGNTNNDNGRIVGYEVWVSTKDEVSVPSGDNAAAYRASWQKDFVKVSEGTWKDNGSRETDVYKVAFFERQEVRHVRLVATATKNSGGDGNNNKFAAIREICFVPVTTNTYANLEGGSLRMDLPNDFTKTFLRFEYKIPQTLGNGMTVDTAEDKLWGWKYGVKDAADVENKTTVAKVKNGKYRLDSDDGCYYSNAVFKNIGKDNFSRSVYIQLVVNYKNQENELLTIYSSVSDRSVQTVAEKIVEAYTGNADEVEQLEYAKGILGYDAQLAGGNNDFTGGKIKLEDCLHTFTKTNEDNTYVISAKSTDAVYLNLTSGLCPHNAEARNIEVRNGGTEGTFKLYDKEKSSHLHFWASPNTKGDRTFDRCETSCGTNDDFEIYKPSTSVTSDIEGYEKVTALSDLENGVYLIVSKSTADDNYYALRPVISDNKYDHVAKVLK